MPEHSASHLNAAISFQVQKLALRYPVLLTVDYRFMLLEVRTTSPGPIQRHPSVPGSHHPRLSVTWPCRLLFPFIEFGCFYVLIFYINNIKKVDICQGVNKRFLTKFSSLMLDLQFGQVNR